MYCGLRGRNPQILLLSHQTCKQCYVVSSHSIYSHIDQLSKLLELLVDVRQSSLAPRVPPVSRIVNIIAHPQMLQHLCPARSVLFLRTMRILGPDLRCVLRILLARSLRPEPSVFFLIHTARASPTCPKHQEVQIEEHGQRVRVWPVRQRVRDGGLNEETDVGDQLLVLGAVASEYISISFSSNKTHAYQMERLGKSSPPLDAPTLVFPVRCKGVIYYAGYYIREREPHSHCCGTYSWNRMANLTTLSE